MFNIWNKTIVTSDCRVCLKSFCCKQHRTEHESSAHEHQSHNQCVKTLPEICLKCNTFVSSFSDLKSECIKTITMKTNVLCERSPNISHNHSSRKRSHSKISSIGSEMLTPCDSSTTQDVATAKERIKKKPRRKTNIPRKISNASTFCDNSNDAKPKEPEEISPKFEGIQSSSTPVVGNESDLRVKLLKSKIECPSTGVRLTPMRCGRRSMSPSSNKNARKSIVVNSDSFAVHSTSSGSTEIAFSTNIPDTSVYGTPSNDVRTPCLKAAKEQEISPKFEGIESSITPVRRNESDLRVKLLKSKVECPSPGVRLTPMKCGQLQMSPSNKNARQSVDYLSVPSTNSRVLEPASPTDTLDMSAYGTPSADFFMTPFLKANARNIKSNSTCLSFNNCISPPKASTSSQQEHSNQHMVNRINEEILSEEQPSKSSLLDTANVQLEVAHKFVLPINDANIKSQPQQLKVQETNNVSKIEVLSNESIDCYEPSIKLGEMTNCQEEFINSGEKTRQLDSELKPITPNPHSSSNLPCVSEDSSVNRVIVSNHVTSDLSHDYDFRTPLPNVQCLDRKSFGILEYPKSVSLEEMLSNDSLLDPNIVWKSFAYSSFDVTSKEFNNNVDCKKSEQNTASKIHELPAEASNRFEEESSEDLKKCESYCFRKLSFTAEPSEKDDTSDSVCHSHQNSLIDEHFSIPESPESSPACQGLVMDSEHLQDELKADDQINMDVTNSGDITSKEGFEGAEDIGSVSGIDNVEMIAVVISGINDCSSKSMVDKKISASKNDSISQSNSTVEGEFILNPSVNLNKPSNEVVSQIEPLMNVVKTDTGTDLDVGVSLKAEEDTTVSNFGHESSKLRIANTAGPDSVVPLGNDVDSFSTASSSMNKSRIKKLAFHSTPIVTRPPERISPLSAEDSRDKARNHHTEVLSGGTTKRGLLGLAKDKLQSVFPSFQSSKSIRSNRSAADSSTAMPPPLLETAPQIPCQSAPDSTIMNLSAIQSTSFSQTLLPSQLPDDGNYRRVSKRRPIWEWPKRRRPISEFKTSSGDKSGDEDSD